MLTRNINFMLVFIIILLLAGASFSQEYLVPGGEGFVRMEIGATHSFNGATWKLVGVNSSQNYIVIQKNSDTVVKVYREDYTLFSGSNIVYCEYFDTAGAYVSFGYSSPNYVTYTNTTVAGNAGTRISFVGTRNSSTFEDSDPSFYNDEIANGWYDHMVRSNSNHTYTADFNIPAGTAVGNYDVWMALDFTDGARFMRKLTITVTEPVTIPEPTSPADGSNVSGTSINFSWSSVSGATSYYLQISPNSSFSSLFFDGSVGNVTSITASGFPNNGTAYYWHVRAYTSAGWGSYGSTWDFTNGTISAPTLASPAAGATNVSINPTLSWGSVSGAASYALQVATNSSFSNLVVNQSGISGTSYSVSLSYNTTYYWRVNATNSSGTSSWSSRSFTTMAEPVTIPEPTSPADGSNVSGTSINFSWSSVSGATSYYLQISPNSSFSSLFFDGSVGNVTSITASGFPNNGTAYYWHVRAYTSAGWGSYGSTWDFTNGTISAPTLASPAAGATNVSINPTLSWGSVSGAASYALQVATNSSFSNLVVNQSSISGTSYSVSLSYSTTYYWRVNATNSSGTSAWASYRSFTTMAEPLQIPDPPVLNSPANGTSGISISSTLSWNAAARATSYTLQVATNSSFSNLVINQSGISGTSYSVSLSYSTTYYWRVSATNSSGTSSWSSRSFNTMDEPLQPPDPPVLNSPGNGVSGINISSTLSWNVAPRAASYALQVATNSSFSNLVVNQSGISGTSYSVSLSYSTTYYWRVNATNSSGTSAWASYRSFTTMDEPLQPPDPPVLNSPGNGVSGISISSTLSWNAAARATSYTLQVATNSSFSNLVVNQSGISGTSYSVSLSYSTTYYWRVSATNSSGTSSWSSRSFTTMDEPIQETFPPSLLSPANGTSGINISSTLSWNTVVQATSYTLQVATNSSFSNLVINQSGITGTSYSVSLSYSTTYYWRVNAANSAGVSMWSTPFSFSTVNAEVSPWYHPNTGISHSVIIPLDANPTIDGLPLVNGDIIGVFFDSSGTAACAGFEVWTGQGNIAISAAGNDATTPLKDGFTEGEKFQWKIWRKSDSRSFNANALYQPVGALGGMVYSLDTFTANGLSALSGLIGNSMSIQQIPYRSGWNLLSSYVEPRSANLDSIFAACRIDLVLLKNGMQKSYIPSQSINQIGNWIPTQGYQAKFNKAGTFTIKGRMQKPEETPISLASGWSILPYLRSSEMPVVSAFASIKDIIIIVKDQDGKTYLPSVSINQINTMKPGQAYQIKLSQAKTFSYPANSAAATRAGKVLSQLENGTADITANFICPWRNKITGSSQTIIIPLSVNLAVPSAVRLEPGDAVGVFYDSTGVQTCAGYEYWDAINNIAVAAAADDPTTPETDGFRAGDSLRWKIWKQSTGEILNIKPIYSPLGSLNSLVTSSAIFEINGLSAMQSFGLTNVTNRLSSLPETCTLMQNYPNPFNPETTIAYALPFNCQVRLEIYNSNGQLVESLVNKAQQAGTYRVRWNSSTVSGIYFYKLSTIPENSSLKSFTSVKKMILIK